MDDLISRHGVIEVLSQYPFEKVVNCISIIEELPSAQPDIARDIATIIENEQDMRVLNAPSAQPEIPEIIRCKDCKYAEVADKEDRQDGYSCQFHRGSIWFSGSYCSWAERKQDADSGGNMSGTHKSTETHSCENQRTETHESCTDCPLYDHDRHNCPRFNKVIPTAIRDAQPRWIPVTEALPKNGHYYLKCTKYGNVDVDYYWDGFEEATKYGEEIVAWMEKPKPYNGGGQDGT